MYDELTRSDLQKMQEEIDYRVQQLRPKLIEDVQTARAFGDLSENFEYKCAKQEKNRNDARIRYLQRMIKTAKVIEDRSAEDTAGLYDTVEIFMENLDVDEVLAQLVDARSQTGAAEVIERLQTGERIARLKVPANHCAVRRAGIDVRIVVRHNSPRELL